MITVIYDTLNNVFISSDCSKNNAPWDVLKMDHLYNLSDVLNYKDVSFMCILKLLGTALLIK